MELLILRHGPAGDKEAWAKTRKPDAERPLTPGGKAKTEKAAAGLAALLPSLDVIAESPLLRSRQTADLLARRFKKTRRVVLKELAPDADPADTLAALAALSARSRAALVGHEPHLSSLVALMIGGRGAKLELKKAGACLLDVGRPAPGGSRLLWLLQPSQLRALR